MPADKRTIGLRPLRRAAHLLGAAALTIGPGLLLPSSATARQHRLTVQSSDSSTASPGEAGTTPPSEAGTSAPGESTGYPSRAGERRAERRDRCHVEATVAPGRLTAGESATVVGSLTCAIPADAAEQTVTIYQRATGTPGISAVGTTTTGASGAFRFTTGAVEADSAFYASSQGARSRRSEVRVTPLVTISGPAESTQLAAVSRRSDAGSPANTLTFAGTVSPDDVGGRVVLQRESATVSENWRRIGLGEVGADGKYSISHTFSKAGTATVRVVVRVPGLLAAASEPLTYVIAPRQGAAPLLEAVKPLLTAEVSSTGVQTGQPLTFSGTIAPAHTGQVVYLERQNPSGIGFHAVDIGAVSAAGTYSIEHTVSGAGTQVFRIKIPGGPGDEAVASELFKIQVTPASAASLEPEAPGAGSTLPEEP
ncbi:MAG: hypothetical protein ACLQBY_11490 [Solirubrobacteraceae bacterium]